MRITTYLVTTVRRTGAFITTLDLVEALRARGHEVTVNPVQPIPADVTISHLGDVRSQTVRSPHFLMVHGANVRLRRLPKYTTAWFPSYSLHRWYRYPDRAVVLRPPVDPYSVMSGDTGEHVTLSQVSRSKGSAQLQYFAESLPHVKFLAVEGNPPRPDPVLAALPNVTVMPRFDDPRDMFALTKIIVMPLGGISYGRIAVEASVSGIPTIATGYAGIREAMGDAATYCSPSYPEHWVEAIDRLYTDPAAYDEAMGKAYARADEIDFEGDTNALCEAVEATA